MSYKPRHWRVPLPVVALASGLLGRPWARKWLELRRLAGINALDFLMPVQAPDGKRFGHTPIRCAEASVWLRELLRPSSVDALSTHSCRATVLSWAAKYGLRPSHRRLLAYHATAGDKS
eukprot:3584902-Amphidinium_carterae.1